MLRCRGRQLFFGWFVDTIIRMGDILDVVWVVSSDGEKIGRVRQTFKTRRRVSFFSAGGMRWNKWELLY